MVEPVTMVLFIPTICRFIYNMLRRKRKLKQENKAREERVKEALRGEQRHAELKAAMNKNQEDWRSRLEAETKRRIEANQQLMQFVQLCIKMFSRTMQQQQNAGASANSSRSYTSQNQRRGHYAETSEYEVEFPDEFGDDRELFTTGFSSSLFQQLQVSEFSDSGECVDHPMNDIAMLELPERENILLLESPDDQYSDEENILSLVLASFKGTSGTDEAKEEGNAYFNHKKFDEAIKCYTKSIDQSPTAAAYGNRAMSYLKLNKFIQAEKDCTEALKIDVDYYKAYARRAIARTKLGHNLNAALEDVEFALEREPNSQEMKKLHADIKCLLSKGSSIERIYDQNSKYYAENATQAKEKGNAYYKEQKFDEAIKCYTKSIHISPSAAAYGNRAEAYMKLNKYAEAEEDCTKALKLDDKYFKAYARRAIARNNLKRNLEGALEDAESALKLEPANLDMKKLRAELM